MRFIYPIKIYSAYNIGQPFGANWADYSQFGLIGHNGVDFPTSRGEPIFAAHDGWIVEQTARETGFGLRISQRIEADGKYYLAIYGHMLRLEVPVDITYNWDNMTRPVKQGQVIGYVDSTGYSTGDHLHFGLYEYAANGDKLNSNNGYGGAIDPSPYIRGKFMSNTQFVHRADTNEYGFYIPATSIESIKDKALNYGVDIEKPDGSVDFSKAKEMQLP
jgi:murein DD-endopeptidase MepM/ murein hydrolase activator NlpD